MKYIDLKKRLQAAEDILNDTKTTHERFEALKHLLAGLSPKTDKLFAMCAKEFSKFDKLQKGEVIELTTDHLPEHTEEQKKKKKLLLLFLGHWKELKKEVKRIQNELEQSEKHGNSLQSKATGMGRIVAFAKGPLGIITVVAAVVVLLNTSAVTVNVTNSGCEPIRFFSSPLPIPGMVLPDEPIVSGETKAVTIPPLTVEVDITSQEQVKIKVLGIQKSFDIGGVDLEMNGDSLSNRTTTVNLGSRKKHELVVSCR